MELFASVVTDESNGKVVKNSSRNKQVEGIISRVWESWCTFTERTGANTVPNDVRTICKTKIKDNYSEEHLIEVTRGAAKMRPHKRDATDTRRLVSAMKSARQEKVALSLARAQEKPYVPFSDDDEEVLSIEAVESATRLDFSQWTRSDIESVSILGEQVTEDDLESVVEQAVIATGLDPIHPSDVLRAFNSKKKAKPKARKKNTYQGGVQELDTLEGAVLEADPAAEKMLMRQKTATEVMKYHSQAPEGYWDKVISVMTEWNSSHESAYAALEEEFDWHPNRRTK